jgi:DNA-binding MarR family transcriptional regulator
MSSPSTELLASADTAPRLRLVVARIARQLRQHVDSGNDLSTTLVSALATVNREGPLTLGQLATAERVQPPSMTRVVGTLEGRGLVARTVDAHDRRVARVSITAEGRRLLHRSRTRKNALLAQRLRTLSPAELAVVEAALPILERLADAPRHEGRL